MQKPRGARRRVLPRHVRLPTVFTSIDLRLCQPGTLVHKVYCELHPHVTLSHLFTHLGCVYVSRHCMET
jgi:hypothetical protein